MSLSARVPTTGLRQFLQRSYITKHATSLNADEVAHNTVERDHKLLNLVYVFSRKAAAKTPIKYTASGSSVLVVTGEGESDEQTRDMSASSQPADADPVVVLLGHKSRDFGKGMWNGFGGKVDVGIDKSITASAVRELEEEVGIKVAGAAGADGQSTTLNESCRHVGILFYQYPAEKQKQTFEVHVYCVDASDSAVHGVPAESEEMHPVSWFEKKDVPLHSMWADDPFWLPQLLDVVSAKTDENGSTDDVSVRKNIENAAFVGYVDFSSMSEVRGAHVLMGKEAVASAVEEMGHAGLLSSSAAASPLSAFECERCPILGDV